MYLLKSGITQIYHDPLVHNILDIQELSNTYRSASLRKTKLQHSILESLSPLVFSRGGEDIFVPLEPVGSLKFFHEFPCPSAITQYSLERLY